ncbi:thiol-disulfide oxidoreductase DCC family protein [Flavobacterium macrobrachii]|jgi:predicted DCC family thiol-disulfide oxidoreductase YuxK|uniref:thiol-disulfide oxidoreductase DCC family protein n=1 Tax=Flavobacterium macrobrachii TaxID=591204 RepID=UPI001CA3BB64|nr:DCC1-like thiol-disulfide oxidoreductase family protein [Flavobacterium macrobrachii]
MEITDLPSDKKIVLFDGVCNLCETSVQFIIQHDKNDVFLFAAIQSEIGQKIINHLGLENRGIDSIILYEPNQAYYYKAEAAKLILKELNTWKSFLYPLIPTGMIGNFFYDYVAKNRYKWYGKKESCMMPSKEVLSKFL